MATEATLVVCPRQGFKTITVDPSGELIHCGSLEMFMRTGGCNGDGCIYLSPHAIHRCPLKPKADEA